MTLLIQLSINPHTVERAEKRKFGAGEKSGVFEAKRYMTKPELLFGTRRASIAGEPACRKARRPGPSEQWLWLLSP